MKTKAEELISKLESSYAEMDDVSTVFILKKEGMAEILDLLKERGETIHRLEAQRTATNRALWKVRKRFADLRGEHFELQKEKDVLVRIGVDLLNTVQVLRRLP